MASRKDCDVNAVFGEVETLYDTIDRSHKSMIGDR